MSPVQYPAGFIHDKDKNRPICGVLSVALCAEVDFEIAFATCKRNAPEHVKRFRGGTYLDQRHAALRELGCKFNSVAAHYFGLSLERFVREAATPGLTYMVDLPRHVVTVKDGIVTDQGKSCPVAEHKSRRKRVEHVTRILSATPQRLVA